MTNTYVYVGNMCGARGVDYEEDPFPGSRELYKKIHFCSGKVLIIPE